MAEAVTIQVEARDPAKNKGTGSRASRRLRQKGRIPAIVYGHKQDPTPISLARDDVWQMIKHATHFASLKIGDATEMVLVRDVQWDHLGKEILHLDFARVSADETIETEVVLELHGTAPGTSEGGLLEHLVHTLKVSCRANAIPERIRLELGDLHVNQGLHVRDLKLPEGVQAAGDPDLLLVHVVSRAAEAEPTPAAEPGTAEPELIGRKAEDKDKEGKEG
ncbi:MAG TPA: 50S ribosomal protein L25 [Isosphaeraceae bacterium]|jgi:large subunit ribosomal protein L25|nr:50S ribosomal protein L25 [Isosphaeraceae bacterium]